MFYVLLIGSSFKKKILALIFYGYDASELHYFDLCTICRHCDGQQFLVRRLQSSNFDIHLAGESDRFSDGIYPGVQDVTGTGLGCHGVSQIRRNRRYIHSRFSSWSVYWPGG